MNEGLDFIGDIHGHADALEALLSHMGYTEERGAYRHASRRVVFLGDFIDGGTQNRRVVEVARAMVDSGQAFAIMGNHEYNAICYHTRDPENPNRWLRSHSPDHRRQHETTLAEIEDNPQAIEEMIGWFRTLPLCLDLESVRAVHACWDPEWIDYLRERLGASATLDDTFLVASARKGSPEHECVETVLKGAETELPAGVSFPDKNNKLRSEARVRWWASQARDLAGMVLGPTSLYEATAGLPPTLDALQAYPPADPPVFFGHYWFTGDPVLQASNVACLDYSVARNGKLVAYRWDGEQELSAARFVW